MSTRRTLPLPFMSRRGHKLVKAYYEAALEAQGMIGPFTDLRSAFETLAQYIGDLERRAKGAS